MKEFFLHTWKNRYSPCSIINRKRRVYPLGSDTKVISAFFLIGDSLILGEVRK